MMNLQRSRFKRREAHYHPAYLARMETELQKLAEALGASCWDSEHQTLLFQRREKDRLRAGMLFEVELFSPRSMRTMVCCTLVANVSPSSMTFSSTKPVYLTRFHLHKIICMADWPACKQLRWQVTQNMRVKTDRKFPKYFQNDLLGQMRETFEPTEEERAWIDMRPVGNEII